MTAVTFPFRPPRLAFAICGRRWQNDVYEIKYSACVISGVFLLTVYFTITANDIIIIIPYCISKRRTHININSEREKTVLRERHGLCLAALKH